MVYIEKFNGKMFEYDPCRFVTDNMNRVMLKIVWVSSRVFRSGIKEGRPYYKVTFEVLSVKKMGAKINVIYDNEDVYVSKSGQTHPGGKIRLHKLSVAAGYYMLFNGNKVPPNKENFDVYELIGRKLIADISVRQTQPDRWVYYLSKETEID